MHMYGILKKIGQINRSGRNGDADVRTDLWTVEEVRVGLTERGALTFIHDCV